MLDLMFSIKHTIARRDPKLERLRDVPLFAACTRDELALVARNVDEHRVEAGRVLTRQGAVGREFFVIVEGTAEVRVGGQLVARLGPGDFVGELALLDRRCRTATVVAETPLVVVVSGTREFAELLAGAPNMTRKLMTGLAARLRAAERTTARAVAAA
ncbi:MAG: cyclic nucleotide-binding domain-containing protein [Ilumatobacteraceae bacterium]